MGFLILSITDVHKEWCVGVGLYELGDNSLLIKMNVVPIDITF